LLNHLGLRCKKQRGFRGTDSQGKMSIGFKPNRESSWSLVFDSLESAWTYATGSLVREV